jgi:hypothetical protein
MFPSLTSDRNYLSLIHKEDITMDASGSSDADFIFPNTYIFSSSRGVYQVTHNLGQVPFVRAYFAPAGNTRYYSYNEGDPQLITVSTTTTTKVGLLTLSSANNIPVHIRIYRFNPDKSFTSDEEIDKIFERDGTHQVAMASAPFSITPVETESTIPHTGGAEALATLQFSVDQTNWYSAGSQIFQGYDLASGPPGGPYARYYFTTAFASSDENSVYIKYRHNNPFAQTIYSRYVLDYKD